MRTSKSLGEIMVGAHASVLAQAGQHVHILMDDGDGRRRVKQEARWLAAGGATGSIDLWSTPRVLKHAGQQPGWIRNGLTWQQVYTQMRPFDNGLPPLPG